MHASSSLHECLHVIVVLVLQLVASVTKIVVWVASIRSEDLAVFAIVQLHIVMRVTMTMETNLFPSLLLLLARALLVLITA